MRSSRVPIVLLTLAVSSWASAALASDGAASAPPPSDPPVGSPQSAVDQANEPRFVLSGFGVAAAGHADGLSGGTGFGGSFAVFFSRILGAEAGVRLQSFDLVGTEANELSGGSLDAVVVTGNVVARFPTSGSVVPYVTGGVAFYRNDFQIDDTVANELAAFNFTALDTVDNVVGFNAGGGVRIALGQSFGIFGEARYLIASADTAGGLMDQISGVSREEAGSQDLNNLSFGFGVSISF